MATDTQMRVPTLRKMEVADILDTAIRLYRHNFLLFLGIVAVVQLVVMAANMVVLWFVLGPTMTPGPGEQIPWDALARLLPLGLVLLASVFALYSLSEGALAFAVSETYLGRRISFAEAYRRVWPLVWRLLLTMILVTLAVGAGTVFCLVPGIILAVWFATTTPIVAVERSSGVAAMSRSHHLVAGHGWRVFGTLLLLYLIVSVATYSLAVPPYLVVILLLGERSPLLAQGALQAISAVTNIIVQPVFMIGIVLVYYDLRIRKEGFDLAMLAEALERGRPGGIPYDLPKSPAPVLAESFQPDEQIILPPRPEPAEWGSEPPGELSNNGD